MGQTGISFLIGLVAGIGGALAIHFIAGSGTSSSNGSLTEQADLGGVVARLDRIEAALKTGMPLSAEPALRGSGGNPEAMEAGADARLDALVAKFEARLKPTIQESVKTSVSEALEGDAAASVRIGRDGGSKKKTMTLAEGAAELGLSREEEDAVRRIAQETTDEFFKLMAGKDTTVEDVKREFEDAKGDDARRDALRTKYLTKVMGNIPGLISLGLTHDGKMKKAVGAEKAAKIDRGYTFTDLDPYGLETLFDFD